MIYKVYEPHKGGFKNKLFILNLPNNSRNDRIKEVKFFLKINDMIKKQREIYHEKIKKYIRENINEFI